MPDLRSNLLALVAPHLMAGEDVWAVCATSNRPVVVTASRLFLLGEDVVEVHDIEEFRAVHRVGNSLVRLEGAARASIAIPIDPDDEEGLQALTILGLLMAIEAGRSARPRRARRTRAQPERNGLPGLADRG